jgi:exodeoxyribonuclease VII large subunit
MIKIEDRTYYSVSEVNDYIKELFDNTYTLQGIGLIGEVTNYRGVNRNGHIYFSLRDEKSSIFAVMFKYDAMSLDFELHEGDKIMAIGNITSYPVAGTYQLVCKKLFPYGKGEMLLKKEELKKKLNAEGLFDEMKKRAIPPYPNKIAVVTAKNSAAKRDFEYNLLRRDPLVEIVFYYASVQGDKAIEELVEALGEASNSDSDVIIFGRGGGSIEDLSAFDDERVVRAVASSKIPIITAIGHEINLSLSDLASDRHASTPTGACEYAVPDMTEVKRELEEMLIAIHSDVARWLNESELKIEKIKNLPFFKDVASYYDKIEVKVDSFKDLIDLALSRALDKKKSELANLKVKLDSLDPTSVLKRGYLLAYGRDGKLVHAKKETTVGESLKLKFYDGDIKVKVEDKGQ